MRLVQAGYRAVVTAGATPDLGGAIVLVARIRENVATFLGTAIAVRGHSYVTPLHVTGGSDEQLAIIYGPRGSQEGYQTKSTLEGKEARIIRADPRFDLCLLSTGMFPEALITEFGSTDEVAPGTPVTVYGYPQAGWGRRVLTRQATDIGARISVKNGPIETKQAIVNMQSGPGQSGSPVVHMGKVVAIILGAYGPGGPGGGILMNGVDTRTLHTTTQAISAEYIERLLR